MSDPHSLLILDTGYTALCPNCYARYNCKQQFINKERNIEFVQCPSCIEKEKKSLAERVIYVEKKERIAEREERYKGMYEDAEA